MGLFLSQIQNLISGVFSLSVYCRPALHWIWEEKPPLPPGTLQVHRHSWTRTSQRKNMLRQYMKQHAEWAEWRVTAFRRQRKLIQASCVDCKAVKLNFWSPDLPLRKAGCCPLFFLNDPSHSQWVQTLQKVPSNLTEYIWFMAGKLRENPTIPSSDRWCL